MRFPLRNNFLKIVLRVLFDMLFLTSRYLCRVFNSMVFKIRIDKLFGNLYTGIDK